MAYGPILARESLHQMMNLRKLKRLKWSCAKKGQERLGFLRARLLIFFVRGTFAHDGGLKPAAEIVRQLVELGIAVDLDGLAGCVADDVAVVAPRQVILEFGLGPIIQRAIEVVG